MDQTDKKDQHTSSEDNQVSQNPRKSSAQELQNDQNGEEVKPSDIVVDAPEVVPPENEPPRIFGKEIKKSASVKQLSSSESNLLCLAQLYVLAIYIAGFVFDVKLAKYHFSDVDIKSYSAMIGSYITAAENLNTKPILDIKVSATMSCPTGYTLSHLGGWPGSENGCYCEDIEEQITSCGDGN